MKPRHRLNFLLVLILAVGLSLSFGGAPQAAVAQVTGPDPSLTDSPANISTSGTLQEGYQMNYNVTVYNNGDAATTPPLTLTASLPQHVTFVSSSSASFNTCSASGTPQVVTCVLPTALNPTTTAQVSITVNLNALSAGTTTTNFTLSGGGDVNTANNNRSVTTTTAGSPDLTITKNHVGSFFSRGNVEKYTFVIKNNGSAASSASVAIVDPVAPLGTSWSALGLDFVSVDPSSTNWTGCGVTTDQFKCTYSASIPSFGQSTTLTINVRPNGTATNPINNNAAVSDSLEPDSFKGNNTSPTDSVPLVTPPDIYFTSMTPQPGTTFTVGGTGQQFQVIVNNDAAAGATTQPVTISGSLPSNMTFNATGSGGGGFTCSAVGQTVTCVHGSVMNPGDTSTFLIPVTVTGTTPSPATFQLTATTPGEADTTDNTISSTVTIATVDLSLTKAAYNVPSTTPATFVVDPTNIKDQGYNFQIHNGGTGATSGNITVTDTLPTGLTYQSSAGSGAGWSCTNSPGDTALNCVYSASIGASADSTQLHVKVGVGTTAGSSVTNSTAAVSGNGDVYPPGTGTSNVAPSVTTTVNIADLTITKSHPDPFTASVTGTYTLTVKNIGGAATSSQVSVTDYLPANFSYSSSTGSDAAWTCTPAGSTPEVVTCTSTGLTLAATTGQSIIKINVVPNIAGLSGSPTGVCPYTGTGYVNCATVSSPDESNTANNTAFDPTNVNGAPAPDMTVSQNYTPNPLTASATGTLTFTVSNVGSANTTLETTVLDNLPSGFTITVAPTGTGWDCSLSTSTSVSCKAAAGITPASTSTISMTIMAPATAGSYPNTVQVTTSGDANATNDSQTVDLVVSPAPLADLTVNKAHTTGFIVNTPNDFNITVTNSGGASTTAATVTIVDTLPPNFTFNSATNDATDSTGVGSWTCTPSGSQITCTISGIVTAGGHYKRLLINATATVAGTSYVNSVVINSTGGGGETNFGNNSDTDPVPVTTTAQPDLTIAMTNSNDFTQGGTSSFTINVSNSGSGPTPGASTVSVTDTLPAGFTYISGSGSGWTCPAASGQTSVTCTYVPGAINAGQTLNPLTIQVKPTNTGTFTNTAAVAPVTGESLTTNNNASNTVTVSGAFDISITKSHAPSNFALGSPSGTNSYLITVQNKGSIPTPLGSTITVTDALDPALGIVSWSSSFFVCSPANPVPAGSTLTCTLNSTLGAGNTRTITIAVDNIPTTPPFPKNFTNTAQATVNSATENDTSNNIANDPTTITSGPVADLSLTKSHTSGNFQIGSTGTYRLVVTNVGSASYTGTVTVQDTLPAGLTYSNFTSVGPGTWTCSGSGQSASCSLASTTLAATNGSSEVDIIVNVVGPAGSVTNNASITSGAPGDPNSTNNSASDPTTLATQAAISPTASGVCVSPATLTTGQTSTITVTARDASNTVLTGRNVTLTASGATGTLTINGTPGTTGTGTSTASFSVSSTTTGTVTFTATIDGVAVSGCPGGSNTVTFTAPVDPNAPSATTSTITANPTTVPNTNPGVDFSTVTVSVRTASGGLPTSASIGVTLNYTTNTGNTTGVTPVSGTTAQATAANGYNVVFQLRSTQNVTVNLSANIADPTTSTNFNITGPSVVFGSGGTGNGVGSTSVVVDCIQIPADNTHAANVTVTIKSSNLGAVAGKTITLAGNPVLAGMTIQPASAVTDANGTAKFTIRSTTVGGPVTFTANNVTDAQTVAQTVQVTFDKVGSNPCVPAPTTPGTLPGVTGGSPADGTVIIYALCIRTGPGFAFSRYAHALPFRTAVRVLGRTTRIPGLGPRDKCIKKGGPTWYFVQLQNGAQVWANASYIRLNDRNAFRTLPVLPQPAAPGTNGAAPSGAPIGDPAPSTAPTATPHP